MARVSAYLNRPLNRSLNRSLTRSLSRHTTVMLGGARRPPPPNYIAIACRAVSELIRIDKRLRPYMEEQRRILEDYRLRQEFEAALRKVYGASVLAALPCHPLLNHARFQASVTRPFS